MMRDPIGFDDAAQLLQDGGCSGEFIQNFLAAMETKTTADLLCILRYQRNLQLGRLHEEGKKLDQLDCLRDLLQKQLSTDRKRSFEETSI